MPGSLTDDQLKWTAAFCGIEEGALRSENDLQLMFDQRTLGDRLAQPRSYKGREDDEAHKRAVDAEVDRRKAKAAEDKTVTDLLAASKRELGELQVNTNTLDRGVNGKMIEEYVQLYSELSDEVNQAEEALKAGQALPALFLKSWSEALYEMGEMRKVLAMNLEVDADREFKDAQDALTKRVAELKKLMAAAARIEDAVKEVEDGEKWVGRMLKIKEIAETIEGNAGSLVKTGKDLLKSEVESRLKSALWDKLTNGAEEIADESSLIEQGVKNLGDYSISLAIAGEGFASVTELQNAISSKTEQIKEAGHALGRAARKKQKAEAQHYAPRSGAPQH